MRGYLRLGAVIATASLLPACATVTRGTHQSFNIISTPSGANVEMTTGMHCTTPCHLKLRRKDEFVATITKLGYKPVQVPVQSKMHGGGGAAMAGNLVAGGLIGGILDGTNGSLRDLKPNPIDVTLVQEDPGGAAPIPTDGKTAGTTTAPAPAPRPN